MRERVRLVARRAARAPDANRAASRRCHSAGTTFAAIDAYDFPVPKELRDVDRERVEQPVVLGARRRRARARSRRRCARRARACAPRCAGAGTSPCSSRSRSRARARSSASARGSRRRARAARSSEDLPHRLEVRAHDRVVRVELERALPAANRLLALLPAQRMLPSLRYTSPPSSGFDLHRAQVRLERLVVARRRDSAGRRDSCAAAPRRGSSCTPRSAIVARRVVVARRARAPPRGC